MEIGNEATTLLFFCVNYYAIDSEDISREQSTKSCTSIL